MSTLTDQIVKVLRLHGDTCTRANADYLAARIAEAMRDMGVVGFVYDDESKRVPRVYTDAGRRSAANTMNPHSFTPDPGTDDELCLNSDCRQPLDHPNHSESW